MRILDSQLKNDSLSQAYIFESPNANFNLSTALDFSKEVFEKEYIYLDNDLNPDLYIIDKEDQIIDIASIRQMLKNMALRPQNNRIRIYIIHNAHNLRSEGANAMLKSLEELKEYNIIIFTTTNSELLLPTIRSRCQIIRLSNKKEALDIDLYKLSEIISEIYLGNISIYYKNKEFFNKYSESKNTIIDSFLILLNDLLKYKYMDFNDIDKAELYNIKNMENISFDSLEEIINLLEKIKIGFRTNINYYLSIEEIIFSIYRGGKASGRSRHKIQTSR